MAINTPICLFEHVDKVICRWQPCTQMASMLCLQPMCTRHPCASNTERYWTVTCISFLDVMHNQNHPLLDNSFCFYCLNYLPVSYNSMSPGAVKIITPPRVNRGNTVQPGIGSDLDSRVYVFWQATHPENLALVVHSH